MPHNFKTLQLDTGFIFAYTGFPFCDSYLLLCCIYTVEVRKKESASSSLCNYHAVASGVKAFLTFYDLSFSEDIDSYLNSRKFTGRYGIKTRILCRCADRIGYYFFCDTVLYRRYCTYAAPQTTAFMY